MIAKLTEQRILQLTEAANIINLCARIINIAHTTYFDGKVPMIGNHARRIRESAEAIPRQMSHIFSRTKPEDYCLDISLAMYDMINFFQDKEPEEIEQILTKLKENKL